MMLIDIIFKFFKIILIRESSKRKGFPLFGSARVEYFGVEDEFTLYECKNVRPTCQASSRLTFLNQGTSENSSYRADAMEIFVENTERSHFTSVRK